MRLARFLNMHPATRPIFITKSITPKTDTLMITILGRSCFSSSSSGITFSTWSLNTTKRTRKRRSVTCLQALLGASSTQTTADEEDVGDDQDGADGRSDDRQQAGERVLVVVARRGVRRGHFVFVLVDTVSWRRGGVKRHCCLLV